MGTGERWIAVADVVDGPDGSALCHGLTWVSPLILRSCGRYML